VGALGMDLYVCRTEKAVTLRRHHNKYAGIIEERYLLCYFSQEVFWSAEFSYLSKVARYFF
jgi:hypothetical protein